MCRKQKIVWLCEIVLIIYLILIKSIPKWIKTIRKSIKIKLTIIIGIKKLRK